MEWQVRLVFQVLLEGLGVRGIADHLDNKDGLVLQDDKVSILMF